MRSSPNEKYPKWEVALMRSRTDGRWSKRALERRPSLGKRSVRRPPTRWSNDIRRNAGGHWMSKAEDRAAWYALEEAYDQQWIVVGWWWWWWWWWWWKKSVSRLGKRITSQHLYHEVRYNLEYSSQSNYFSLTKTALPNTNVYKQTFTEQNFSNYLYNTIQIDTEHPFSNRLKSDTKRQFTKHETTAFEILLKHEKVSFVET